MGPMAVPRALQLYETGFKYSTATCMKNAFGQEIPEPHTML